MRSFEVSNDTSQIENLNVKTKSIEKEIDAMTIGGTIDIINDSCSIESESL